MTRWLAVPGYDGAYEVSDDAQVRSLPRVVVRRNGMRCTVHGGPMRLRLHQGYPTVRLTIEGKGRTVPVHVLVATAFLGPPPTPRHEVRHGDGVRAHSWLSNLSWGTKAENQRDAVGHGTSPIVAYNREHRRGLCKRGHQLARPNLLTCPSRPPEHRECKACSQGMREAARLRDRGEMPDIKIICDRYYDKIMGKVAA